MIHLTLRIALQIINYYNIMLRRTILGKDGLSFAHLFYDTVYGEADYRSVSSLALHQ